MSFDAKFLHKLGHLDSSEKAGFEVQEYDGIYYLLPTAHRDLVWVKHRFNGIYEERDKPIRLRLGNKSTAIINLCEILKIITGKDYTPY